MKLRQISPEFVNEIPRELAPGKLYICCPYRAVKHVCACGCGTEINTPLHPTAWTLICDGVSVSLSPSIGNWSEECQSHYWIRNNQIRWASKFSRYEILQTRRKSEWEREQYFNTHTKPEIFYRDPDRLAILLATQRLFSRIWHWIIRRS